MRTVAQLVYVSCRYILYKYKIGIIIIIHTYKYILFGGDWVALYNIYVYCISNYMSTDCGF